MITRVVDRALLGVSAPRPHRPSPEAIALHARVPVVDLLVGTPLFRRTMLEPASTGHVDLPRLRSVGTNLVGLSLATRFPDPRGTLSAAQFLGLGVPARALRSDLAIVSFLVRRIDAWAAASPNAFVVVRSGADLDRVLAPNGPVGAFIGVQGGQVLGTDEALLPAAVARLRALGIRMFGLAHVMDSPLAGSGSGRRAGGLTPLGRIAVAELERASIVVDLAHGSSGTIRDTVACASRPPVISHTGFLERAARASRWRRYSAATRNVRMADARLVAGAGGIVGVVTVVTLLGGSTVRDLVDTIRFAIDELGPAHVAIGSDMDGALRSVVDASGLPLITDGLLARGVPEPDIVAVLGGNALRILRPALDGASADSGRSAEGHRPALQDLTAGGTC